MDKFKRCVSINSGTAGVNPAGELAYDTTAVRQNGDINATRIELNINGFQDRQLEFKGL